MTILQRDAAHFKSDEPEERRHGAENPYVEVDRLGGSYILIILLDRRRAISVGALGTVVFEAGAYAYVGSALRGLDARIDRHLRDEKKLHWHIDYLLQHAEIVDVVRVYTDQRLECRIAAPLCDRLPRVDGFGCSDCSCPSHLFGPERLSALKEAVDHVVEAVCLR